MRGPSLRTLMILIMVLLLLITAIGLGGIQAYCVSGNLQNLVRRSAENVVAV